MSEKAVTAASVSIEYGRGRVLSDVSLICAAGEFVALVGESGVGKTSFLNALAGFIPYSGDIGIPGRVGYVFQNHAAFPWMTAAQNVEFGLEHLKKSERRQRARDLLAQTGMAEFAERYPSQLSGGQVQRVAFARALAPGPDVLLMDEPYGALDQHTRERMQEWLLTVWQETRKTVVFVTHNIEEAVFLADRVIVVNDGRFCADITVPFQRPRCGDLRFEPAFLALKHDVLDRMRGNVVELSAGGG